MKNLKYTKGEWRIELDSKKTSNSIGITIKSGDKDLFFTPNEDKESKANAKLVASAPELLEASIELLSIYDSYGITLPTELKKKFENAIKKSTE